MGALEKHDVAIGGERVVSTVTRRVETVLPETGSREWWALYLLAPLVLLGGGILVFPTLVYDRFIWQYLWGPVVADAAGQPVTHEGIRAVQGYNAVNTVIYLAAVVYSLPGLRAYLDQLDVTFDARLAYGFAPIIIAGGAMRALEDIDLAFVCMNLPYTMDVDQAADAVADFEPAIVYPYHYRGQDVADFKRQVNERTDAVEVRLGDWYPE